MLTRRVIERIRERKRSGTVATTSAACGASAATLANAKATSALDGKYRFEVTDEELRAEGVTDADVSTTAACGPGRCPTASTAGSSGLRPTSRTTPTWSRRSAAAMGVDGDRLVLRIAGGPDAVWRWRRTAAGDLRVRGRDGRRNRQRSRARPGLQTPGSGSATDEARDACPPAGHSRARRVLRRRVGDEGGRDRRRRSRCGSPPWTIRGHPAVDRGERVRPPGRRRSRTAGSGSSRSWTP